MAARTLDWTDWLTIGALTLICLVALVYVPFGWWGIKTVVMSATVAAWVQGVGTVAAVVVGAQMVRWQISRQSEAARAVVDALEVQRLQMIGCTIFYSYYLIAAIRWTSEQGHPVGRLVEDLERQVEQLARISLIDLPDWRSVYAIDTVRSAFTMLAERLERIEDSAGSATPERLHARRVPIFNVAEDNIRAAVVTVRAAIQSRGVAMADMVFRLDGRQVSTADFE